MYSCIFSFYSTLQKKTSIPTDVSATTTFKCNRFVFHSLCKCLQNFQKFVKCWSLSGRLKSTYSSKSCNVSLGAVFLPDSKCCNLLTLCVAVETGVIVGSFSFRYLRPVSGVDGARLRVCSKERWTHGLLGNGHVCTFSQTHLLNFTCWGFWWLLLSTKFFITENNIILKYASQIYQTFTDSQKIPLVCYEPIKLCFFPYASTEVLYYCLHKKWITTEKSKTKCFMPLHVAHPHELFNHC